MILWTFCYSFLAFLTFTGQTADQWSHCGMQRHINTKSKLVLVRSSWILIKRSSLLMEPVLHYSHIKPLKGYLSISVATQLKKGCKMKQEGWLLLSGILFCDKLMTWLQLWFIPNAVMTFCILLSFSVLLNLNCLMNFWIFLHMCLVRAITHRFLRRRKVVHHNCLSVRLVLLSLSNKLCIKQVMCLYMCAFDGKRIINPLTGFFCRCFINNSRY